jgi:pathogenesis-related protein 1
VSGVSAANLGRTTHRTAEKLHTQVAREHIKGHVVTDADPTVLDFSDSPFSDSILNLALNDPFKTNPKNGTPWFRYTKKAGRGQANHSHFDGLVATGDFPEDILHAHNVVRERSGIKPLQWSSGLHEMASARVLKLANEGCYIKHSPLRDRWYEAGFEYIGENLYKVINMKPTGVDIVDAWYAEIEDYTYGLVGDACVKERCAGRTSPPCMMGHFTQVMWAKSTHVGCARAECPDQTKRTFVAVCNYGPGGNIVGRYPFPAVNSKEMGLSMQDCRMRPQATKPSVWEEVKEGKLPNFRSRAWHQATTSLAAVFGLSTLLYSSW